MKRAIFITLTVIWVAFIFFNSTRVGTDSSDTSGSIVAIVQNFLNILNIRVDSNILSVIVRKVAHLFEFFVLGIFSYNFIKSFNITKKKILYKRVSVYSFIIVLAFCLVIAGIDEFIQYYIPGRANSIIDVSIDFLGSCFAIVLVLLLNYKKIKSTLNKSQ